jgi:hypothetical protein
VLVVVLVLDGERVPKQSLDRLRSSSSGEAGGSYRRRLGIEKEHEDENENENENDQLTEI